MSALLRVFRPCESIAEVNLSDLNFSMNIWGVSADEIDDSKLSDSELCVM